MLRYDFEDPCQWIAHNKDRLFLEHKSREFWLLDFNLRVCRVLAGRGVGGLNERHLALGLQSTIHNQEPTYPRNYIIHLVVKKQFIRSTIGWIENLPLVLEKLEKPLVDCLLHHSAPSKFD